MKKKKVSKKKREKIQDEYYNSIPDEKRNPNHKEDFEKVLQMLAPPIKPNKK